MQRALRYSVYFCLLSLHIHAQFNVKNVQVPVPLYTIIFYFSESGLKSVQPVLAENTSWSKTRGMGGPFDSDLSTFLTTTMTADSWKEGLYFFMYALDSKGSFLSSLSGISTTNPANVYIAVLDSNFNQKYNVKIPDLGTIPFSSFGFNLNRAGASVNVNYAELCLLANPVKKKASVSRNVLFSSIGITPTPSDIVPQGDQLSSLSFSLTFTNGDTISLPFVASQITNIQQETAAGKSVTLSCELDATGANYAATIQAKTPAGNVSGFPLTISSADFKTSGGSSIPTSNNYNTQKKISYKTSNMKKALSVLANSFVFGGDPGSTVIPGAKKAKLPKVPTAKGGDSAGGRF